MDVDRPRAEPPEDPAEAVEEAAGPAIPRWVVVRFLLLLAFVGLGFVVLRFTPLGERLNELLDRERLMELRAALQARWWTAPLLVVLYVVLAPLGAPVSPLMLAGGAIFGTLVGSLLNFLGTFLGAAVSFLLARALGRDFVVHLAGDRLRRAERLIARRGFWTLVRTRFLPLPFPLVNYGAALAGVPAGLFLVTTAIGLLPANLVFTYFASALVDSVAGDRAMVFLRLGLAVAALLALSFLPTAIIGRRRRRRYRAHRETRRRRPRG
ncbi:MAG TPA: VTT domain-containing protein [Thermoanaerobaculia bacterium]|nr:VTT domain-containing protein [Thermoanaerobaculia bacterium]